MDKLSLIIAILVFFLGWFSNEVFSYISFNDKELPYFSLNSEQASPANRIKENQIQIFKDKILINVQNAFLASYADTNSMDPLIDQGANGIEIKPEIPEYIQIGDIIAYTPSWTNGLVAHRVVEIGSDNQGIYYIAKGDNNPDADPGKIRFNQIKYVLIGVIY